VEYYLNTVHVSILIPHYLDMMSDQWLIWANLDIPSLIPLRSLSSGGVPLRIRRLAHLFIFSLTHLLILTSRPSPTESLIPYQLCRSRKTVPTLRSIRVQFRPAGRSLARQQSPLGEARHIGSSASASPFRRLPQSLNRSLQPRRLAGPPVPLRIRRVRLPDGFPWRALEEPGQGLPVAQRTDCLG
jgi:hypothetical protein